MNENITVSLSRNVWFEFVSAIIDKAAYYQIIFLDNPDPEEDPPGWTDQYNNFKREAFYLADQIGFPASEWYKSCYKKWVKEVKI